jgi:hypothetical protein
VNSRLLRAGDWGWGIGDSEFRIRDCRVGIWSEFSIIDP